ncbi:DUF1611 domain-containing protein [Steroidobacter sp.]|uniref:DUF1611 domain-containing protein n=1 Tax=Steroidobacter sp. TaxID=1978227 RepID=UPI001A42CFAE|nr:DUF1611 domain-containing protein [Steroidobacter sp.]MBL8267359.1 DUF1611 domain-containing protein [Steroidobacter sp.]
MSAVPVIHAAAVTRIPQPYLLFLGNAHETTFMKTALGLRDWARELCVGEYRCDSTPISIGLPYMDPATAYRAGARSLVIGVANIGGIIDPSWIDYLVRGMEAGLDIVSGAHSKLRDCSPLQKAAERTGRSLINIRVPPQGIPVATGRKRSGKRLLTVGTDCALGKKYTALTLHRELRSRGIDSDFRATGQTGILISGAGIPIDAVVSDFVAGAAEMLSPDAPANHWDVIEGQGSVFHPSYAGVSLGLLHGSQPDVLVLCHEVGRDRIVGLEGYATPSLPEAIELTTRLARMTNPNARCAGVSLNTSRLDESAARQVLRETSAALKLPVADPVRGGPELGELVERILGR